MASETPCQVLDLIHRTSPSISQKQILDYINSLSPVQQLHEISSFFQSLALFDENVDDLVSQLWTIVFEPRVYSSSYSKLEDLQSTSPLLSFFC